MESLPTPAHGELSFATLLMVAAVAFVFFSEPQHYQH
jgi:hypothetical protein